MKRRSFAALSILAVMVLLGGGIEVISYHPFSEYKRTYPEEIYRNGNEAFNNVLKSQALVDAYAYKTMLGTQYHPQYTYDTLETSLVFDYLVGQLIIQMTDQEEGRTDNRAFQKE